MDGTLAVQMGSEGRRTTARMASIRAGIAASTGRPSLVLIATLLAVAFSAVQASAAATVYAPGSSPAGKTYAQWSAAWWKWADGMEITHHPMYDTAPISTAQSGPVWFFGG